MDKKEVDNKDNKDLNVVVSLYQSFVSRIPQQMSRKHSFAMMMCPHALATAPARLMLFLARKAQFKWSVVELWDSCRLMALNQTI